ncbi:complement C3-like [Arapaima gigas]
MGPAYQAAIFIVLCYGSACLAGPLYLMVAPNVFHVETLETVYLEAQDAQGEVPVTVEVYDFPLKSRVLSTAQITLNSNSKYQGIAEIKIRKNDIQRDEKDPKKNHYVYLQAKFSEERVLAEVLVSFQSGYAFIQTDKPIYNPSENVQYRVFGTDSRAKSVNNIMTVKIKNPDGIIVHEEPRVNVEDGILSKVYNLPEVLGEGTWTIEAHLQSQSEKPFSTQFDVKKHVLPTFAVTVRPRKKFFHVNEQELIVDIEARYLFDNDVQGTAYVMFGVLRKSGTRKNFQSSLNRERLERGTATAILKRKDIPSKVEDMLGDSIYIRAQVVTSTGVDIVEAEATVKVVNSSYEIFFPKSSKYFKPGLPASLYVKVVLPDGSPAENLDLNIQSTDNKNIKTDSRGLAIITVNTGKDEQQKTVIVRTAGRNVPDSHQTQKTIILYAFQTTNSKEYMHLSFGETLVMPDSTPIITIHFSRDSTVERLTTKNVSYMVVSKGQIIRADKWPVTENQQVIKQPLQVTREMLPSFRLVAYYTLPGRNYEVVSDSLWIDMEDVCQGTLEVSIYKQRAEYTPNSMIKLQVKGDEGAQVGLGIVDKAAFTLSNKGLLTQTKIWDTVEDRDIGCTRGGGKNNMGIFTDAGLIFTSSAEERTTPRQSHSCSSDGVLQKKRRAVTLIEMKLELENNYKENVLKKCCRDGMTEFPLDYSCEKRSLYITESQECVEAFLRCCNSIKDKKQYYNVQELLLSRNSESAFDENAIYVRSKFDVSWKWNTIRLTGKPGPDGLVTYEDKLPLKDSITEWQVMGISASSSKGICVAKPLMIMVKKRFFVDLRLPYSVVNKEQVNIKVVLHNYEGEDLMVTVELLKHEFLCSEASANGKSRRTVSVPSDSSKLVEFTIIPLKMGTHNVLVRAFDRSKEVGDAIKKPLRVVAEGVETFSKIVRILNPAGRGGKQREEFSLLPPDDHLPGLDTTSYLTILGDELADTVENSLGGDVLSRLIKMPKGCVEQNLASMTCPLIATRYLDSSRSWESVGVEKRQEALSHIRTGFQNQLQYRKNDDSYPPYANKDPSTWVTAYTAKVFAMALAVIPVDSDRVCKPISFLVTHKQDSGGHFIEGAPVYSASLMGGTRGQGHPGLTAFVLIAMKEAQVICERNIPSFHSSMKRASDYLLRELPNLSSPYALSITSYALALYGIPSTTLLTHLKRADSSPEYNKATLDEVLIEAKGYSLLALLVLNELSLATPVSEWLRERASESGQFGSTQSTMVVFQALAQYKLQEPQKTEKKLDVKLSISGKSDSNQYTFTRNTWSLARSKKVPKLENFVIEAEGSGTGKIVVQTVYNVIPQQKKESCLGYDMDIQMKPLSSDALSKYGMYSWHLLKDRIIVNLTLASSVRLPGTPETMTVLAVSIPTGFVPYWKHLDKLNEQVDKLIDYYDFDTELSQKGSLNIHLYRVSPTACEHCVPVILIQEFIVGLLQPATVTAYSYYNRARNCTKMYHPEGNSTKLGTICSGDVCKCAESKMKMQSNLHLTQLKTNSRLVSSTVYKMKLIEVQQKQLLDKYVMEIEEPVKLGEDQVQNRSRRTFVSHVSCRKPLNLKENQKYLIIGEPDSILKTSKGEFHYVFTSNTWLEPIPTAAQCQGAQASVCIAIKEFLDELQVYGCPT